MRPTSAPSLGERLQRAGLVDASTLEGLVAALRERLRNGTPTSLGRILLERGVPTTRILAVATSGERLAAIRCDACSTIQPVPAGAAREFPCARCGAYLLPLGPTTDTAPSGTIVDASVMPIPSSPSATIVDASILPLPGAPAAPAAPVGSLLAAPMVPALENPEPDEDTTMPLGMIAGGFGAASAGFRTTDRFESVLPIPGSVPDSPSRGGTTKGFPNVLPIPAAQQPALGVAAQVAALPAPPMAPADLPGSGTEDPTVTIPAVEIPPPAPGNLAGPIGIPPLINSRPPFAAPAPPPSAFAPAPPPPGIPPVINQGRPPSLDKSRELGVDTERPTVADVEGSGGAFAEASAPPATGNRSTTVEAKSPLTSKERERARSGRPKKQKSNVMLVVLASVLTFVVAALVIVVLSLARII